MIARRRLAALLATLAGSAVAVAQEGAAPDALAPEAAPTPEAIAALIAARAAGAAPSDDADDLAPFAEAAKGYERVVSSADGATSFYGIWRREKDQQLLAEIPDGFEDQLLFVACTVAAGTPTAGVQSTDLVVRWQRIGNRLVLVVPNLDVRTTGDAESKAGRDRVFTDRVLLDVGIVARGEKGGVVIDLDDLLLGNATSFFGAEGAGNRRLATIERAKAFPRNVEIAFRLPLAGGRFGTLHYSISPLPDTEGYTPRAADARVGYFVAAHMDVGHPDRDDPTVRHITRWKLEKADPRLKASPPKEPIVFYLEHTIPVRYRRWVREGVLAWNDAFEEIGIIGAIEVAQQDAGTGAHMEKDPEDARYNFLLWTNANMGFAIGPSRVDPRTGRILDADIVMDEGFVTSWANTWRDLIPESATRDFGPETLAWLASRPQWDPRVRLAPPTEREAVARSLVDRARRAPFAGHPAGAADPALLGDDRYDGLAARPVQVNGRCDCGRLRGAELALFRLDPGLLPALAGDDADDDADTEDEQLLDGVPEWFIGPLLKDVVMHEVGHTLGLRHNFKASTAWSLDEINGERGMERPITGSVMDYTPVNIASREGETQGAYAMPGLGPYDVWAIACGYGDASELPALLARNTEPELIYGTDEDSFGSDPRARVFDLGRDPIDYADAQMAMVHRLRRVIAERMVDEGESWAKARRGWELLLGKQAAALSIAANWVGGVYSDRAKKGDPDAPPPVRPVEAERQRRALAFVTANAFRDEAWGVDPETLAVLGLDKWFDDFATVFADPAWPVHDRILALQASSLTGLLNPGVLNRVLDNELRTPSDEDALTLPELFETIRAEIWIELAAKGGGPWTNREPMITSLRRNLQREHLERLIDLALPNPGLGAAEKPVAALAAMQLRRLDGLAEGALSKKGLDDYATAHLLETRARIEGALAAIYVYNADALGGGGMALPFFFGEDAAGR